MRRLALHLTILLIATIAMAAAAHRETFGGKSGIRAFGAIQPRVSPDGASIAFSFHGAIWRLQRFGRTMRRLTSGPGFDSSPAWSADGNRLAYLADGRLRVVDAQSAEPIRLSADVQSSGKLYFHPDGSRLLGRFGETRRLSWLHLESGQTVELIKDSPRISAYALSPSGDHVVYVSTQDLVGEQDGNDGPQGDVWIVSSNGGEARRLMQFKSRIFDVWWGPQGLTVASDLGGAHNDLWTIDIDDPARIRRITSGQADEDAASVSADGRWLVYTDNREGATSLICRDLQDGLEQALSVADIDFLAPTGILAVKVVDDATGKPTTARVVVRQENGKYFAPPGALYWILEGVEHFYMAREARVTVPTGRYQIRAFRGIEYLEASVDVDVSPSRETPVRLAMRRWTNPAARGWWGGEGHVHGNYGHGQWYNTPESLRLQVEGEGLNIANMVVANSDTDGIFDREFFRGAPDPASTAEHVLYWNEEFRSTLWGHMTLLNLQRLVEPVMTGFKDTTNPWDTPLNGEIADHVHLQGGHVSYTHPLVNARDPFMAAYSAKALPVDVALGKIDSLDINGSYENTVPIWHRLLNCGFRLPASAGTDVFLNRMRSRPPGASRAYVWIDGAFSYDSWIKGLKAGRSFVTDGPMLEVTANGQGMGQTITLAKPSGVSIQAHVSASSPVTRFELLERGTVVASSLGDGRSEAADLSITLRINQSGWLGVRAYESSGRQAHSSPIYIEMASRPASSVLDAAYFLDWIDRLEERFLTRKRTPSARHEAYVRRELEDARAVYRRIADK